MPQWQVVLLRPAQKYLDSLGADQRARVVTALAALSEAPLQAPIKKLKGRDEWNLRIGELRALLRLDPGRMLIAVTRIGPRGDIYRG